MQQFHSATSISTAENNNVDQQNLTISTASDNNNMGISSLLSDICDNTFDNMDDQCSYTNTSDVPENVIAPVMPTNLLFKSHNTSTQKYIETSVISGIQQSTKILVCDSVFQKNSYNHIVEHISMDTILMFLNLSKLVFLNGRDGQDVIIDLLQSFWKFLPINDRNWLPLPYNHTMFQSNILNPCNSKSLLSQLPIPYTFKLPNNNHAYCSLEECIHHVSFFIKGKTITI